MKLSTNITLVNGIYGVEVAVPANALTLSEQELLGQFGEPLVDLGGNITAGNTTVTLAAHQIRVPSGLPHKVQFDRADYDDAAGLLANEYADFARTTIGDAIEAQKDGNQTATLGLVIGDVPPP